MGYILDCTGDKTYTYTQSSASALWVVTHTLSKYPSVTILDDSNNVVIADVQYIDENTIQISFASAVTGSVILN